MRVGIIGPESCGKSTLARYLAKRYNGVLVPEYPREYIERKGSKEVSFDELCEIAKHQIEEIQSLADRSERLEDVCFFDTELIVTKVWFEYAFGRVPKWLENAIKEYPMDVYLLCAPDIPWEPDPTRYNGSDAIRQELFARYEQEIQSLNIPYYIITHPSSSPEDE